MKYIVTYFIFFIAYYLIFVLYKLIGKKEYIDYKTVLIIAKKNNFKMNDKKSNKLLKICLITLSGIISIPTVFAFYSKFDYLVTVAISLLMFLILIILAYYILSFILKKKGW